MMLAATFAGMGFGNAGVHIPHANGYPIAGMVRDYRPAGYPQDEPMVPHGQSVSLTAPEAFRFSFESRAGAAPARGRGCWPRTRSRQHDPREQLPAVLIGLMRDIGIPNGIGGVGYTEARRARAGPGHHEAAAPASHLRRAPPPRTTSPTSSSAPSRTGDHAALRPTTQPSGGLRRVGKGCAVSAELAAALGVAGSGTPPAI